MSSVRRSTTISEADDGEEGEKSSPKNESPAATSETDGLGFCESGDFS